MSKKETKKEDTSSSLGLLILDQVELMQSGVYKTCEIFCKEFDQSSVPLHILKSFQDEQIRIYRENFKPNKDEKK